MVYIVLRCVDDGGWKLTRVDGVFKTEQLARNYISRHQFEMDEDEWFELETWMVKES